MRRRALLGLVGGMLTTAGCGSDTSETPSPTRSDRSPTASPAPTGSATPTDRISSPTGGTPGDRAVDAGPVDRIRVAGFPADVPLEGTVEVLDTGSQCAVVVDASIRNRDDERHVLFSGGNYELPFGTLTAEDGDNRLVLEAVRETPPRASDGTCPRVTPVTLPASAMESLAPSASVANQAPVVGHVGNDPAFPSGRYRFRTSYRLDPEEQDRQFEWGFTLIVE